jgi:AcrR family transcriptional regulator
MPRPKGDIEPRIVAAARRRFEKKGVDGASLRAIAKDAGTSIGMIYYYFPTKDDLFLSVVESTYERVLADLEATLAPGLPARERLQNLFTRLARLSDDEISMMRLIAREALVSSSRLDRLIERFKVGHVPLILRTIFDGLGEGLLDRSRHPLVLLFATAGLAGPPQLMRRVLGDRLPLPGLPTPDALAHELVDVLLNGVGVRNKG